MKNSLRAAAIAILTVATPLAAEEGEPGMSEGFSLIEEGARLLMRGLMAELEPALREVEPALRELHDMLGELNAYHPPEIRPNGDIILRRKVPLDAEEIEL